MGSGLDQVYVKSDLILSALILLAEEEVAVFGRLMEVCDDELKFVDIEFLSNREMSLFALTGLQIR